jgi:seryl-tRNA synthetase
MLSKKQLRNEIKKVAELLQRRGFTFDIEQYNNLETERKQLQIETQDLQNERNVQSKSIGKAKANGEDIEPLLKQVANLGEKLE